MSETEKKPLATEIEELDVRLDVVETLPAGASNPELLAKLERFEAAFDRVFGKGNW